MLPKVRQLREWADEARGGGTEIEVDGGIDTETGPGAAAAGATAFVAATAIFMSDVPVGQAIARLRQSLADAVVA